MTEEIYLFDSKLSASIEDLIKEAKDKLTLISPYIDLSERVKSNLKIQLEKKNPNFKLKVLFGKNGKEKLIKQDKSGKNLKASLEFFMEFPNVEIRFEKRLHAKFYINDYHMIFSSMNLYNFSLENNIEFGIIEKYSSKGILGKVSDVSNELAYKIQDNISEKVWGSKKITDPIEKFENIFDTAELLYKTEPKLAIKKGLSAKLIGKVGIELKEVIDKVIVLDNLSELLSTKLSLTKNDNFKSTSKSIRKGYCINTGVEIPFDIKKPMSYVAFKSWNKLGDIEYSEKYCHFSGELSNGATSVSRPILKKNWKKAKEKFDL